jgi:apolipoprotein N-acyltransferase
MDDRSNLRRALIFTPIAIALGVLTAYGQDIMPPDLVGAIVVFLFAALFLIFFGLPRWKASPTRQRVTIPGILLVFIVGGLAFAGAAWMERKIPQVVPWLTFAMMLVLFTLGLVLKRRSAGK